MDRNNMPERPDSLTLRPVQPSDAEFLYRVYAGTRIEELAPLGWNEAQQEAFLRMQFAAQHQHYQTYYADADFLVILRQAIPIGRVYIHRGAKEIRLMDIALLPDARGMGIGSALLHDLLAEADHAGKLVSLHVEPYNPALRLYARLGFTPVQEVGVYVLMERLPQTSKIS